MRWLIWVVLGIVLVIGILLTAALGVGKVLDNSEMIAFQSREQGDVDIYLRDGRTGLTHNVTEQRDRRLASRNETGSAYVPMYATQPQSLSTQGDDVTPIWSPNGRYLAFVSRRDGNPEIYILDLSTGRMQNVSNHSAADSSPVWSPDSKQIAFQSKRGRYWDIYVIDLESGETHNLTNSTRDDFNPVWAASN